MNVQEPNYVNVPKSTTQSMTRKPKITTLEFDALFDASSSEEELPPTESPVPDIKEPEPEKPPQLRKADPRDKDNFRPLRGKEMGMAQQFSESGDEEIRVTHMSSDDVRLNAPNRQWNADLKMGRFEGAEAISSNDVFQQQEQSFTDYLLGKAERAVKTVQEALVDDT